jgi:hypothetical protein
MRRSSVPSSAFLAALVLLFSPAAARAASLPAIDGVRLGTAFAPGRQYQCSASEQFTGLNSCRRTRQEKTRQGRFTSTTTVLHGQGGTAIYVNREIRPAFFAPHDIPAEIIRLADRQEAAPREMRASQRDDLPTALIAIWGSLQLEELHPADVEQARAAGESLLVDYLGDIPRSLQLGLPVYRFKSGSGFLWSASERGGRGHLRYLTIDVAALTAAPATVHAAAIPEVTGSLPAAAVREKSNARPTPVKVHSEPFAAEKARVEAERNRILVAEQIAAEERAKARVAWARFEEQQAVAEARARMKWMLLILLVTVVAVIALLRIMRRREENASRPARSNHIPEALQASLKGFFGCAANVLERARSRLLKGMAPTHAQTSGSTAS